MIGQSSSRRLSKLRVVVDSGIAGVSGTVGLCWQATSTNASGSKSNFITLAFPLLFERFQFDSVL